MKEKQKRYYPKKEKLKAQLVAIAQGKITKEQAMLKSGYAPSVARRQTRVWGYVAQDMQQALREHGVDENRISVAIDSGMDERDMIGFNYVKLAAQLLDAFPKEIPGTLTDENKNSDEFYKEFCDVVGRITALRRRIEAAHSNRGEDGKAAGEEIEAESAE